MEKAGKEQRLEVEDTMKRRIGILCILMILAGSLAGCGGEKSASGSGGGAERNVVEIKKDGAVTNTIEEELNPDYYDVEALKEFVVRESNQYNHDEGADKVSIKKIDMKDDMVTVTMECQTAEDFGMFNGYPFFYGTVAEAYEAGYNLDMQFRGGDGESITKDELLEMGSRRIVIVELPKDETLTVSTGSKILYYAGDAVTEVNKSEADMAGEGTACLIFK